MAILGDWLEIVTAKLVQFVAGLHMQSSYACWFVAAPKVDAILARKQGKMRNFKMRFGENEVDRDVLGVDSK